MVRGKHGRFPDLAFFHLAVAQEGIGVTSVAGQARGMMEIISLILSFLIYS
jgi:hypothetical protein